MNDQEPIIKATFNPAIKHYIFWLTAIIFLVSIIFIPLLIIWFLGFGQWSSKRYYNSLYCDLTSKRLRFKKGVFNKVEKTIPLENIQDISFNENPLLRYFGLCILKIETAGQSNRTGSDMTLIGIKNSYPFKNKVLAQREALINQKYEQQQPLQKENSNIIDELKAIKKVMTELLKEVKKTNQ